MGELHRLYIDESGDHKYHDYTNPRYDSTKNRYLALMGVIFECENYSQIHDDLENLKRKHFNSDPDDPIILHRQEIVYKRGPFKVLQDSVREEVFNNDLIEFLDNLDCILILVVLDKKYLKETYIRPFHPYHYALKLMLERYCGYLKFISKRGDVMAEHRGGEEDKKLKSEYTSIYQSGTRYHSASDFQTTLTSKEIKIKPKEKNITGLQIADVLANPCKYELLLEKGRVERQEAEFGRIICDCVRDKYNKHLPDGRVEGYGKIFLG